jgi:hypothetical protein
VSRAEPLASVEGCFDEETSMARRVKSAFLTITCVTLVSAALGAIPGAGSPGQTAVNPRDAARRARFTHDANVDPETGAASLPRIAAVAATEAPAGFTNETNGFDPQGPAFESLNEVNVVPLRSFNDNRFIFEQVETITNGLGPTYNAQSCRECHQNIVTGGASQVTVQRAGHLLNGEFFDSQGGSLIHSRATHPDATELLTGGDDIRTFRISPNTLGDGFVEAIANDTLFRIRDSQPLSLRGLAVVVPVLEANGRARIGRFGWKSQHASLESFAVDAYLNEMGITTPLLPVENTAAGRDVSAYDTVPDPEDDGDDARVRQFHARDDGAAARRRERADRGGGAGVRPDRMCHMPRDVDVHGACRDAD